MDFLVRWAVGHRLILVCFSSSLPFSGKGIKMLAPENGCHILL